MGGFFGAVSSEPEAVEKTMMDVFIGTDYHSHLGTKSAGLAWIDQHGQLRRKIHSIQEAPFRSKFNTLVSQQKARVAMGLINDTDPQPLQVYSRFGIYTLAFIGVINNAEQLAQDYVQKFGGQFGSQREGTVNTTELLAAYINTKDSLVEGINYAWEKIDGTALIMVLQADSTIILARDADGRLPLSLGKSPDGYAFSLESFAYQKLGYENYCRLGAGEIGQLTANGYRQLQAPLRNQKICSFMWVYYGYPASTYEGRNVEQMRYANGQIMAENDAKIAAEATGQCTPKDQGTSLDIECGLRPQQCACAGGAGIGGAGEGAGGAGEGAGNRSVVCGEPVGNAPDRSEEPQIDGVAGVPDSGIAHAVGYANASQKRYLRPFVKYTPSWSRSFIPVEQSQRNQVAKMKLIPVQELITGKRLLFIDDSIVRGTQLRETVDFLYQNGAEEIHVRSASPPIMYGCKYLNFSRSTSLQELITHQVINDLEGKTGLEYIDEYISPFTARGRRLRAEIAKRLNLATVEFQTIEGIVQSINLPKDQLCTYCFNGKE